MKLLLVSLLMVIIYLIGESAPWPNLVECLHCGPKSMPKERNGHLGANGRHQNGEKGTTSGTKEDGGRRWERMNGMALERALSGKEPPKILGIISKLEGPVENGPVGTEGEIVEILGMDEEEDAANCAVRPESSVPCAGVQFQEKGRNVDADIFGKKTAKEFIEYLKARKKGKMPAKNGKSEEELRREKGKQESDHFLIDQKKGKFFEEKLRREREELTEEMCRPEAIRALGRINGEREEEEEKEEPGKHDGIGEEKAALDRKGPIQLALRKYFCDKIRKKLDDHQHGGWERLPATKSKKPFKEFLHEPKEVDRFERIFRRADPLLGHHFQWDFKFTVFFPEQFDRLWKLFGADETLLLAMTRKRLKGFDIDTKGGSKLFTSWDGQFFFKSVRMEAKGMIGGLVKGEWLEPILEKDFFFKHDDADGGGKFQNWSETERRVKKAAAMAGDDGGESGEKDKWKGYRGAFTNQYLAYMLNCSGKSLLPKYFMLFHFQPLTSDGTPPPQSGANSNARPLLFTVQNGLFPEHIPKISYKFDLKGSTDGRFTDIEKAKGKIAGGKEPNWKDRNLIEFGGRKGKRMGGFFPEAILIAPDKHEQIRRMIGNDSQFLADLTIMDYSLLMGVHFVDSETENKGSRGKRRSFNVGAIFPATSTKFDDKLALRKGEKIEKNREKYELQIFLGIIDILQPYNMKKMMESVVKSAKNLGRPTPYPSEQKYERMSVIGPEKYQQRFVDFLTFVVLKNELASVPPSPATAAAGN